MGAVRENHRAPWTPEQEQQLRDLVAGKATVLEAARKLGRTAEAVQNKALKMNVNFLVSPRSAPRR